MLDQKSKLVLKILCKECQGGSYKIIETSDIISALPSRERTDSEGIRHILIYLERQDMISIKYDDEGVYCLAVMPYGRECAEAEVNKKIIKKEEKTRKKSNIWLIFLTFFVFSLISNFLALLIYNSIFK